MTRHQAHGAALLALAICVAAVIAGPPTAPLWVRWAGLALTVPAIAMFVATAPRSTR